jgi:FkbM family methyltransferase
MENINQSPMSAGDLVDALHELGSRDESRNKLVELLQEFESSVPVGNDINVRELVTGPIVDALYGYDRPFTKTLSNGIIFSARYTSKIIRDFIMSDDAAPDHVWEPQTTRTLLNLCKDAKNVVIGGAYMGDQAVPLAHQLRTIGTVHCFELSEKNNKLLSLNARQNILDNIVINEIGLWSDENVKLTLDGDDSHAAPKVNTTGFSVTTIDAYGKKNNIECLDLILLDIEGGELAALKGADGFLKQNKEKAPHVIFEIHSSYTDWKNGVENTDIVKYLVKNGYEVFGLRDYNSNVSMAGKPVELVELDGMYTDGPSHGFNMLATKRRSELDPVLFKFVTGVSPKLLKHRDPKYFSPLN